MLQKLYFVLYSVMNLTISLYIHFDYQAFIIIIVVATVFTSSVSSAEIRNDDKHLPIASIPKDDLSQTVHSVKDQLEANTAILATLETKISELLIVVHRLDTTVKVLQEKAHVWEIFRHHIGAWTNHQDSVDKKIELLRRKLDEKLPDSTMLQLLLNIDRLKEGVDTIKTQRLVNESPTFDWSVHMEKLAAKEQSDALEKKELMHKLTTIQRQVSALERDHCKPYEVLRSRKIVGGAAPTSYQEGSASEMASVAKKLDMLIENFMSQEFKQVS